MRTVPIVKDGFVMVPVESAKQIAEWLRMLNEIIGAISKSEITEYGAIESNAYCLEQAEN